jgi:hypothetical protein
MFLTILVQRRKTLIRIRNNTQIRDDVENKLKIEKAW